MKKLVIVSGIAILALAAGCGDDTAVAPDATAPVIDGAAFERPEFIDTRPEDVIQACTLTAKDAWRATPATPDKAGKYALVIGISDYEGTVNDLQYCDDDAIDWKNYLEGEGYQVTALIDGAATKAAIEAAVADLASLSIAGNEIAFAYSGHGSRGNLISADLSYIADSWMGAMFDGVGSTKMAFSIDACRIGEFGPALDAPGRVIALASDRRRSSYDGTADMQNGVFTYFQMEGFDQMGFIYMEEDAAYAVAEMKAWAASVRVKVAPSYVDSYVGDLDL